MRDLLLLLLIPILIVLGCFALFTPSSLMITDELSYYFQMLDWLYDDYAAVVDSVSQKPHNLIEGHYPSGTSLILSMFYYIDHRLVYFSGLCYYVLSIIATYFIIKDLSKSYLSLAPLFLFVPLILISRTTMSEMPSLLLVSLGVFLFIKKDKYPSAYLWLAFITGVSIAFRETNLLLLAPLAIYVSRNYIWSLLVFLLGGTVRLYTYYITTGNPFFIKEGAPFGVEYILSTIWIYAIVLVVLLPFSFLWIRKLPRVEYRLFGFSLLSFLMLHLFYGYLAHQYSGIVNGVILNGRFWIPTLPLFIVALAYFIEDQKWLKSNLVSYVYVIIVAVVQVSTHLVADNKEQEYLTVSDTVAEYSKGYLVATDLRMRTGMRRYIYPIIHDRSFTEILQIYDSVNLENIWKKHKQFRVMSIESNGTHQQMKRANKEKPILDKLKKEYNVKLIEENCPSFCLKVYEVRK